MAVAALTCSVLSTTSAWADDSPGKGSILRVDTHADRADAHPGDGECADAHGDCSLRAAVQEANAAGGGEIRLDRGTYELTIDGRDEDASATGDLDVTTRIAIHGDDATVDARGIDRVLDVAAGAHLRLDEVTITGGAAEGTGLPASGGGVRNAGELEVHDSTITCNTAVRAGGGIEASADSTTTISRSTLSKNSTGPGPGNGGGLHITASGTVTVDRSTVTGNTAAAEGGGLWNDTGSTMHVSRSVISDNTASGPEATNGGGGLFTIGGELVVDRSEIRGNSADGTSGSGGGILNDAGTLVVERSVIEHNSASRAGGGIEANVGTTTLDRTVLTRNTTGANPGNGGGLHLTGAGTVTIDRGTVTRNTAAAEGGGLWNSAPGTMTVPRTEIRRNSAPVGPDVFQDGQGTGFTVDGEVVPPTEG
ncbi:right-handed parallel beta-helix repeat-containing protein [Pseudonocardia nigra]|uniref:right-handed parallel beta-helix repeat-containing protein n=1 Tax=Pseudonocardia nigra TaxID=1921578 RepID=UPI001C5CF3F7|nr:right-handed parallel beta-helix repeat-containing protein [Pseudonocardia nigra]